MRTADFQPPQTAITTEPGMENGKVVEGKERQEDLEDCWN